MQNRYLNLSLLLLRLFVGLIMVYTGAQKLFGVFGGAGFMGTLKMFETIFHIPPYLTVVDIFVEFFGGTALVFGFFTRVASFGVAIVMAVATSLYFHELPTVFEGKGFQTVNALRDIGWPASFLVMSLVLMMLGSGSFSLDALLFGRKRK